MDGLLRESDYGARVAGEVILGPSWEWGGGGQKMLWLLATPLVRCGCKEVDVETEVKQARWIRCENNRDGGRLNSAEKRNSVYQVASNYIS